MKLFENPLPDTSNIVYNLKYLYYNFKCNFYKPRNYSWVQPLVTDLKVWSYSDEDESVNTKTHFYEL